jgi:NADPH:quinone reductase-like Zn-dependent oxidoreductase
MLLYNIQYFLFMTACFIGPLSFGAYRVIKNLGHDFHPAKSSKTETMKAAVYRSHGDSSVIELSLDYPRPILSSRQVLIQIHAAALNPVDYKMRRNQVPEIVLPLPKIPGADVAGVVIESRSPMFKVGDRVAAMIPLTGSSWGGYAEYVAVDHSLVAAIAHNISFIEAASIPLVGLTCLNAFDKIKSPQGKSILVHAGAGGVGTFAIQWAKHLGMGSIYTTSSASHTKLLQELGATNVIDYNSQDFSAVAKEVDVVLDPMSYMYEGKSLQPGTV